MEDMCELIGDITKKRLPYCMVCYRTEKDRRLVSPRAILQFYKATSTTQCPEDKWVCHICEQHALKAMQLVRAIRLARDMGRSVWDLASHMPSHKVAHNLPKHLGFHGNSKKSKPNKLLECLRKTGHLAYTQVLIVDSMSTGKDKRKSSDEDIDTIVLDDEDSDMQTIPPLVPTEQLLKSSDTIVQPNANYPQNNMFVLPASIPDLNNQETIYIYPVPGNQGHMVYKSVPSNTILINPDQPLNVLSDQHNAKTQLNVIPNLGLPITVSNNTLVINGDSLSMLNRGYNLDRVNLQNEMTTSSNEPNLTTTQQTAASIQLHVTPTQINVQPNQLNAMPTQLNAMPTQLNAKPVQLNASSAKLNVTSKPTSQNKKMKYELDAIISQIFNDVDTPEDGKSDICIENPRSVDETEHVGASTLVIGHEVLAKLPTFDSTRIDWEDKIPMDVISFMDANDPNSGQMLDGMTSVGSLKTMQDSEIINLC